MVLIKNLGNTLIISMTLVFVLLIILIIIEKILHKKIIKNQGSRNIFYINKIESINKTNLDKALTDIDQITRDFFKEAFNIKQNIGYTKLENFFNQKNDTEAAEFCNLMNDSLYSGKKNKKEYIQKWVLSLTVQKLILSLTNIVQNNPLFTEEELRRKKLEKTGLVNYLKNIKIPGISKKKLDNKQDNSEQN